MDCEEFCRFIDLYLDGELEGRERAEFDGHVASCPSCRGLVDQQIWMRRATRERLERPCHMPEAARRRLQTRLRAASRPRRATRVASRLAFPALAAGAMVAFTTLSGFTPAVDVKEIVEQHHLPRPVEVPSPEAREIDHWFRGKLSFDMIAPRFDDARVTLLGGRLSRVGTLNDQLPTRDAAYLIYGIGREKMTVLVFDGRDIDITAAGHQRKVGDRTLAVHDMDDVRVAIYKRGNLAYAVTSPLSESLLLKVISSVH